MTREPNHILDELLVLRAQDGDERALTQLVARWHGRLVRHAAQVTGCEHVAVDVAQESWLAIVRGLRKLKDPATFRRWAYRIVHNKSVDCIRDRKRRREAMTDLANQHDNGAPRSALPDTGALRQAIGLLSTEQQMLLRMYYTDRMGLKEIAYVTNVAEGTVKYRLFKTRKQLQEMLERESNE